MKICPYCKEQIPDNAKICPECNEKIDITKNTTKITIVCILFALLALLGLGFSGYKVNAENTPLEEVQELNSELQPVQYLQMMIKDEEALTQKLKNPEDKENNDKYFTVFYKNLLKYHRAFIDSTSYEMDMPIEKYFETEGIILKNSNGTKMNFVNPKTYIIYYESAEAILGYEIDHDYLRKKYAKYLSDEYTEFLSLSYQEDKDSEESAYMDAIRSFYKRWYKQWSEFISKYPSFALNDIIKETVEAYSEY